MRELHVVTVSEDGRHVLLGATKGAKSPTYRVRLDARLVAAVRGDLRAHDAPEVDLSPKEIQARLRAGESAEQIAAAAGLPVTRVARFAGPVAGEMARTIAAAQEGYVVRGRRGRSTTPLGVAVAAALEQAADSAEWSTKRDEDGRWLVTVRWAARGRQREAGWWYQPGSPDLTALDPASAALGHVDAEPPRKRTAALSGKPGPGVRTGAATKQAAKPAAKPAAAASGKAPTKRPARATPGAAGPVKAARPRLKVVPDPPTTRTSGTKDQRDGVTSRASVPAWADVLLGTTPGGDR